MDKLFEIQEELKKLNDKYWDLYPKQHDFRTISNMRKVIKMGEIMELGRGKSLIKSDTHYTLLDRLTYNLKVAEVIKKYDELETIHLEIDSKIEDFKEVYRNSFIESVNDLSLDYIEDNVAKNFRSKVKEIKSLIVEKAKSLTFNDMRYHNAFAIKKNGDGLFVINCMPYQSFKYKIEVDINYNDFIRFNPLDTAIHRGYRADYEVNNPMVTIV
jgi:hypothetical protein